MSNSSPKRRGLMRFRRARGQSLVEFALTFPLLVIMLFIIFIGWILFQQQSVYLDSARTVAEEVARQGQYTTAMSQAINQQLNNTNGVNSSNVYLFMVAVAPDGTINQCGTQAPTSPGNNATAPAVDGWTSCLTVMTSANLPVGSRVEVDVWGYQLTEVPFLPITGMTTPTGHAVSYVLFGG